MVNVFDPWARDRGEYYNLQWKTRQGAASDRASEKAVEDSRECRDIVNRVAAP